MYKKKELSLQKRFLLKNKLQKYGRYCNFKKVNY